MARHERQEFQCIQLVCASVIGGVHDDVVGDLKLLERERSPLNIARNKPNAVFLRKRVPYPSPFASTLRRDKRTETCVLL